MTAAVKVVNRKDFIFYSNIQSYILNINLPSFPLSLKFIIISFSGEASIKGASYQVLVGANVIFDQIYNNRS